MQLTGNETDNPDQRISEDIKLFIENTWQYSFSFVQNIYTLITYIIMLWASRPPYPCSLAGGTGLSPATSTS
jgi:putative ATP-binding cassette transporter